VTSSQCKGCHDASALLSVQSGGQHTWAAPQMSFKHPTAWGDTQPPADKFNLLPYGEWSVSIMALAARDPVFLAQAETERVLTASVTPTAIDMHVEGLPAQDDMAGGATRRRRPGGGTRRCRRA
jgi:hypothetical protein